jgi:hypothetical protein
VVFCTPAIARDPAELPKIRRRREGSRRATRRQERNYFMLRTSSLLGPINSGFVPFASGAPVDAPAELDHGDSAEAEAAEVVARAAAVAAPPHADIAPWVPTSSARIRIVEGAVLAAVCAYFGWGLVRALAGF